MTTRRARTRAIRFGLVAAFATSNAAFGADLPTVFVSIPPQKFVVEQLAGDSLQVQVMLPSGASPATYEPTPRQMAALNTAVLYLEIGAPFEGPILTRISALMPDLEVVDCREGITLEPMEPHGHGHGENLLDPHIWLDPVRMKSVARTTAEALSDKFPDAAPDIERALTHLLVAIDEIDHWIESELKPFAGRELLVFHPAYGYFTRRYGLLQIAVETEGKAPSARRLAEIVDSFRDRSTPAIFVQPQFSQTAAKRVADALGCRLVVLDPLAEEYLVNLRNMAERIATEMAN